MRDESVLKTLFLGLGVPEDDLDRFIAYEVDETADPVLAPMLFAQALWPFVLKRGDSGWLEETINHYERREGLTGAAAVFWPSDDEYLQALRVLHNAGVADALTTVVHTAQYLLLMRMAALLDNPEEDNNGTEGAPFWGLFETDESGKPIRRIKTLQSTFEELDEMENP